MKSQHYQTLAALATIVTLVLGGPAQADEKTRFIQDVRYDVSTGELLIENQDDVALTPEKVAHSARHRELVFYLPEASIQPTPKVIPVKNDPIVREIRLEQRALNSVPAVRVKVSLYTSAPFLPFSLSPSTPGLRLSFGRDTGNTKLMDAVTSKTPEPSKVGVKGEPTAGLYTALAIPPVKSEPAGTMRFTAANTPLTLAAGPANAANSVLGDVSPDLVSIIQDIYFEEGSLNVVSQKRPLEIKRSFQLTEPNRYVVDISPAVLSSKTLLRAIPQTGSGLVSLRAGQFDENTVRIVAQFAAAPLPVKLTQWEENRVLKMTFQN